MKTSNTLLVIGYVWPEPQSSAAGQHILSLIKAFSEDGWHVTFASPAIRGETRANLTALGINEVDIALNCSSFDTFVEKLAPDVVLFDRFMLEEQYGWRVAKSCPDAVRILDTEDLHFLRQARHQAHKQARNVTDADLKGDMAKREIASILRCDLSLIISDVEYALLTDQFHVDPALLLHCPFMLNLNALPDTHRQFSERQDFVCIGNFRHAPNWDAVLWLSHSLWPAIRKRLPKAKLNVYGAYAPPKATQLHAADKGFHIKGWVDDADDAIQSSKVCLAPLRFGAGIKGKLTDAMRCGTPSVTTPIGAEGMHGDLPWPGEICDNIEDLVNGAVNLYENEVLWSDAQKKGFALLTERYDGEKIARQLLARVAALRANLNDHRLNNFVGAMLQHHQHKSTQYMSQWIEAKNRLSGES